MSTYYFACSYPLEPGSIVNPGNWGRIVAAYRTDGFGNPWLLFREEIFESVRKNNFPKKPSRYEGIFLCESEQNLSDFLQGNNRVLDLIYEVELADPSATVHRGCLSHLDFAAREDLSTLTRKANDYWNAQQVHVPEILVESSVKILRRI